MQEAPKSFLSLDTEGRVIRIDSFSKVLSSGLRIGVITAAAPLVASVELHMQSSHLHAPTLSQVYIYIYTSRKLLTKIIIIIFPLSLYIYLKSIIAIGKIKLTVFTRHKTIIIYINHDDNYYFSTIKSR